jgi:hypothetical protein
MSIRIPERSRLMDVPQMKMVQRYKQPYPKDAEDIKQDSQEDRLAGNRKAKRQICCQTERNKEQCILGNLFPSEEEKDFITNLKAGGWGGGHGGIHGCFAPHPQKENWIVLHLMKEPLRMSGLKKGITRAVEEGQP